VSGTQIEAILTLLAQARVDFVVIGGVAGLAHGSARVTFDLDLCYKRTSENIARLCETLAPLNPRLRGAPEGLPLRLDPETVKAGLNFTLTTDLGALDLLGEVSGLGGYEGVRAASEALALYGFEMNVLSLEGLLVAKRTAARGKDKEAMVELEALLELRKRQPPS
jgi:predicted nucleotidyltransferase